jgi:hypothetical protein
MDFLKKAMNSNKQGGSTNKDGSKGDITTSIFDKATKKAGWDLPPEADKKITDAAKNMFGSFGSKK